MKLFVPKWREAKVSKLQNGYVYISEDFKGTALPFIGKCMNSK